MSKAIIVCGGDFLPSLLPQRNPGDILIAADSGYSYLLSAGIRPDVAIGDWDSLGYQPSGCEVCTLAVRKDDTDFAACAKYAAEKGFRELVFLGALGGKRFSHSLANVQLLGWLSEQGIRSRILDEHCTIEALGAGESIAFPEDTKGTLSVFSLTEQTTVTLRGLWYTGEKLELSSHYPLGVSNAFIGEPAEILCHTGTAIVIAEHSH